MGVARSLLFLCSPDEVIDAILAKKNLGTTPKDADLVIALGPGFIAGEDAHILVETNRGHNLGELIFSGPTADNTGIPGEIEGYSKERVLRSPVGGLFKREKKIGDYVSAGDAVGVVENQAVRTEIGGVIRGLIMSGTHVHKGLKIGDVDPRARIEFCHTLSDKARAIGGAVLMAVLMRYNV
jgi:xanthine dehydrogenase accessory factor